MFLKTAKEYLKWTAGVQMKLRCEAPNFFQGVNLKLLKLLLKLRWSHLNFVCINVVQINIISRLILVTGKEELDKLVFIAQLVEHYSANAEAIGSSPSSSKTQGLLAEMMRYFRAKVYLKSWRAPGNLFLLNQFQKWLNSVLLIGQKNFFFCPISDEVLPGNSVGFLHEVVLFIDRLSCLARTTGRLSWRVSEKKN